MSMEVQGSKTQIQREADRWSSKEILSRRQSLPKLGQISIAPTDGARRKYRAEK